MVTEECYTQEDSPLFGCRPVAFIHDEIILEAPLERVPWAGRRLAEVMVKAGEKWCPDVPLTAEAAAATFWSKDVVPVYDDFKLLTLWTP